MMAEKYWICPNCFAQNDAAETLCTVCGHETTLRIKQEKPRPERKSKVQRTPAADIKPEKKDTAITAPAAETKPEKKETGTAAPAAAAAAYKPGFLSRLPGIAYVVLLIWYAGWMIDLSQYFSTFADFFEYAGNGLAGLFGNPEMLLNKFVYYFDSFDLSWVPGQYEAIYRTIEAFFRNGSGAISTGGIWRMFYIGLTILWICRITIRNHRCSRRDSGTVIPPLLEMTITELLLSIVSLAVNLSPGIPASSAAIFMWSKFAFEYAAIALAGLVIAGILLAVIRRNTHRKWKGSEIWTFILTLALQAALMYAFH